VKRIILYAGDNGASLFLSKSTDDAGCFADEWYESVDEASLACHERFGVEDAMWQDVPDPEPGCQEDWIAPVRKPDGGSSSDV
jgi:biofilm protein TabA